MKKKLFISIVAVVIIALSVVSISSLVRLNNLQKDFGALSVTINSGAPSAGKITFCKAVEGYIANPIFVTAEADNELGALGICPHGIPTSQNRATFAVYGTDAVTEGVANAEFLEISAGSPCWGTDDFIIAVGAFGNGVVRSLSFGGERTGEGAGHQIAFTIVTQDGEDIYTCFIKDVELLASLITSYDSRLGLFGVTPIGQQAHIEDADGTIEDLTYEFNELLRALEAYGLLSDGS